MLLSEKQKRCVNMALSHNGINPKTFPAAATELLKKFGGVDHIDSPHWTNAGFVAVMAYCELLSEGFYNRTKGYWNNQENFLVESFVERLKRLCNDWDAFIWKRYKGEYVCIEELPLIELERLCNSSTAKAGD